MTDWHVVEHHYDSEATTPTLDDDGELTHKKSPVYRLIVGQVVERQIPQTDGEGNAVYRQVEATNADGNVILEQVQTGTDEETGEPIVEDGDPLLAQEQVVDVVTELVPVEDFVFAADDERWEGKTPAQVAALQRRLVKNALDRRAEEAAEEAKKQAARVDLPGTGEAL
jgi:hypothetical protein